LWFPERTNQFKKQYKNLNSDLKIKIQNTIKELCESNNPTKLGNYKKHMKVYSYEIGNNYRIIYDVQLAEQVIVFIRVGDHKSAYGKD